MPESEFPRFTLKKKDRIRRHSEYVRIFREGKRFRLRFFTVVITPNEDGRSRLGIVVSKKIGKAVVRNRIKRYVRESYRIHKRFFPQNRNYVFVAQKGAYSLTYQDTVRELYSLLEISAH